VQAHEAHVDDGDAGCAQLFVGGEGLGEQAADPFEGAGDGVR
jgi:hypothetical protein